jgi:gas vesicle protein
MMMKMKSLLIGFVTGAIVAGTATILSTPSSGRNLRIRLQNSKDELLATAEELLTKIYEIKNEALAAAQLSKESIMLFISDVQFLIEDWKREMEPSKTELVKHIQEIETSLKELEDLIPTSTK